MADSKISALADGVTPAGTDMFVVDRAGTSNKRLSWTELLAAMPGAEIGYDQITSTVNVVSTTEATGTTIIPGSAHTFDGAPVIAEFFSPQVTIGNLPSGLDYVVISLFESATQIGRFAVPILTNLGTGQLFCVPVLARYRFTPSAGAHTYSVTAYTNSTTGTPNVTAGAGGTAAALPAYLRFTKV